MRFDAKEFGGRIRDLRKKQGITQEQLSIMLNISANHLAKVETGSRCCSIELLQDLSSCLNVRTDYLLNGRGKLTKKNGDVFEGEFKNGLVDGNVRDYKFSRVLYVLNLLHS